MRSALRDLLLFGGTSFTPDKAATPLAGWYRSDSGHYSAGSYTELTGLAGTPNLADRSGSGWTWVANKYGGKPLFRPNSNSSQMWASIPGLSQPLTTFQVVRFRSRRTAQLVYDGVTANRAAVYASGQFSDVAAITYAGGLGPSAATPLGRVRILENVWDGSSSTMRFNGGTLGTGNPGSLAPNGICWGNGGDNTEPFAANADYGELIVYAGTLSAADRAKVMTYLTSRWRLNGDNGFTVICGGDSLTRGFSNDALYYFQNSYPGKMQVSRPSWNVVNIGYDSTYASGALGEFNAVVTPSYNAADARKAFVFGWGINDLRGGTTPAQLLGQAESYADLCAGLGLEFFVRTLSDFTDAAVPTLRTLIDQYRALVLGSTKWNAATNVVDITANALIGAAGTSTSGNGYFSSDNAHLNDAGYGVSAALTEAKLAV